MTTTATSTVEVSGASTPRGRGRLKMIAALEQKSSSALSFNWSAHVNVDRYAGAIGSIVEALARRSSVPGLDPRPGRSVGSPTDHAAVAGAWEPFEQLDPAIAEVLATNLLV